MKRLRHCRRNKTGEGRNGRWKQPGVLFREKEAVPVGSRKTLGTIRRLLLLLSRFSSVRLCATHRWQPTRLPCPWDSPGKSTGVGCHFLLQCMKVKSKMKLLSRVRLLETPWTAAYQAPPSMGFSRQEYWSGVPLPSPDKEVRSRK